MKQKHAIPNTRHPLKRRRLASVAFASSRAINTSDAEETDEDLPAVGGKACGAVSALQSDVGQQTINRSRSRRRDVAARPKKGEDRNINGRIIVDFAGTPDDDSSPKKRKRDERESGSEGESGSWVEVEEDEEEPPDFIAESE